MPFLFGEQRCVTSDPQSYWECFLHNPQGIATDIKDKDKQKTGAHPVRFERFEFLQFTKGSAHETRLCYKRSPKAKLHLEFLIQLLIINIQCLANPKKNWWNPFSQEPTLPLGKFSKAPEVQKNQRSSCKSTHPLCSSIPLLWENLPHKTTKI